MRLLGKYPPDVIAKSLPEYYKEIRPRLDEVTTELVTLRADKAPVDLWQSFDRYEAVIHELLQFLSKAERSLPALTAALQDSRKRRVAQSVFVALLSALAGALITWLLSNVIK
jgi:chromosome segregation ATPase